MYRVTVTSKNNTEFKLERSFQDYTGFESYLFGVEDVLNSLNSRDGFIVNVTDGRDRSGGCTCPIKKNDGAPFDGVSYSCLLHGR